ncbi:uncharacterized protein LOC135845621 isoform X1 [Planococcus citri]|uniref:uncharacterized protein LOC135845621 isoform X1 n=1 Tax=Planococcus citri TaxID=170843 RepID=UPI0031F86D9E
MKSLAKDLLLLFTLISASVLVNGQLNISVSVPIIGQLNISTSIPINDQLNIQVYNPQNEGIFPVASSFISNQHDAILFDAQFSTIDGEKVLQMIKTSNKTLKQIIITCGDPDMYFGLEPIVEAYPNISIVATPRVVNRINQTKDYKLSIWGPKLKEGTPKKIYLPVASNETKFTLGHQTFEIKSGDKYSAYVWIESYKTIFGGTGLFWGIHAFSADTQTVESRADWRQVLKEMIALKPKRVIPGHYLGEVPAGDESIKFSLKYLEEFEKVLKKNNYKNSTAVIADMKELYPNLGSEISLELSAKVNTGEMKF